ncbi:MAG: PAS domain S-box protein, partial [Anaerohalosphaera sp.]|nr:PAS domain S-box protein [Anaerohalosphaera sp.]
MITEFIFFVYGLAFFILGFAIFLYPKKHSDFGLARYINLIACFGVLHGINEWIDMFIIILTHDAAAVNESTLVVSSLELVRLVVLPVSFLFLVHFASRVLPDRFGNRRFLGYLTPIIVGLWLVVMLAGQRSGVRLDIWSRYLICFPGAFLAGFGLLLCCADFKAKGLPKVVVDLRVAGGALIAYSVISGLIVPAGDFWPASVFNYDGFQSVFGFRVQILRAVSAAVMAFGIVGLLRVFSWESTEALRRSQIRFNAVIDNSPVFVFITDADHKIIFVQGKGLESLGKVEGDVVGKGVGDVFGESAKMSDCRDRAMGGEVCALNASVDGVSFNVSLGPLRNERGGVEGVVGVAADVTELVRAQAELDKYKDEMTRSKDMVLLGTVSMAMAEQVEGPLDEARKLLFKSLSRLDKTIGAEDVKRGIKDGLVEISKAFLSINRFYTKANIQKRPKAEPVYLREMVERILAVFEDVARQRLLRFSTRGIDVVPCLYMTDRELEQMLFIPIQNAVQSADGKSARQLSIDCGMEEGMLVLKFADTCGGVDPAKMAGMMNIGTGEIGNGNGAGGFGLAVLGKLVDA